MGPRVKTLLCTLEYFGILLWPNNREQCLIIWKQCPIIGCAAVVVHKNSHLARSLSCMRREYASHFLSDRLCLKSLHFICKVKVFLFCTYCCTVGVQLLGKLILRQVHCTRAIYSQLIFGLGKNKATVKLALTFSALNSMRYRT